MQSRRVPVRIPSFSIPQRFPDMIPAIATFLVFQLAGEVIARLAGLPVPGPVLGAILLLLVLILRGNVPEPLHAVSSAILRNLSLLFVPAGVGLVLQGARIRSEWEAIAAALIGSTVLTLLVTATVFRLFARRRPHDTR